VMSPSIQSTAKTVPARLGPAGMEFVGLDWLHQRVGRHWPGPRSGPLAEQPDRRPVRRSVGREHPAPAPVERRPAPTELPVRLRPARCSALWSPVRTNSRPPRSPAERALWWQAERLPRAVRPGASQSPRGSGRWPRVPRLQIVFRTSHCRWRASPSAVERLGLRVSRKPIGRTPPCPSPQRGQSCFRLRAPLQARRHGPLPLLSLLRSGRGVAGPVSCGSCSLKGFHRVVMSASPLSGTGPRAFGAGAWHHPFGSARTAQSRTLCPDVRFRLSEAPSPLCSRPYGSRRHLDPAHHDRAPTIGDRNRCG